ncbi:MAG TPA: rhomboid family intramembrane serine protease [Burkholderiaceae bacterium]|nr:rhomboid family intramembrane serine protease [Burkholderiaceae bacterium]
MSPVTHTLLAINFAVFALQILVGGPIETPFALWPLDHGFLPWQIVTSAFLHAGLLHIATNMFGLWMFGREVEYAVGSNRFLWLYLLSVVAASVTQLVVTTLTGSIYPTVGASGGLFGVLAAFAMLFPRRIIMLLIPPIPLPARVFVLLYAALELYFGVTETQAGIAHFAHLGGLVGGYFVVRRWRRPRHYER